MRITWLIALCVVLVAAPLRAQRQPYVAAGLVAGEARDSSAFFAMVQQLDERIVGLEKKTPVSAPELAAVRRQADAVKAAIPRLQRAIAGTISKLKGAGKWTPDFDRYVEDTARANGVSDQLLRGLRTQGGARAVLERMQALIPQIAPDVDKEVKSLESKGVAIRMLEELLGKPVNAGLQTTFWSCFGFLYSVAYCAVEFDCDSLKKSYVRCVY